MKENKEMQFVSAKCEQPLRDTPSIMCMDKLDIESNEPSHTMLHVLTPTDCQNISRLLWEYFSEHLDISAINNRGLHIAEPKKGGAHRDFRTEGYMSTKEAADYLGLSERGVRVAAEEGRLPGRKNSASKSRGNRWMFKRTELDKHMKAHTVARHSEDVSIWK